MTSDRIAPALILLLLAAATAAGSIETPPSIRSPLKDGYTEQVRGVRNAFSLDALRSCVQDGDAEGLRFDLRGQTTLLDGSAVDPARVRGRIFTGPYPLSGDRAAYDTYQFRQTTPVRNGQGRLGISQLENWPDTAWVNGGMLVARIELALESPENDRDLGTYEFLVRFSREEDGYRRAPGVIEGPFIGPLDSAEPERAIIHLRTDAAIPVRMEWGESPAAAGASADSPAGLQHEIRLEGLKPDTEYRYRVTLDGWSSPAHAFRTPPRKGEGTFHFAYAGDSRDGVGGGARAFMGVNALILEREMNAAWQKDARFWLHGGDLLGGHTSVPQDFRTQFAAFKWVASAFWRERPVYSVMGNHDCLLRSFEKGEDRLGLDRWPYATESSEAVFTEEMYNPVNGPIPSDPDRPPYGETVFSMQYGPLLVLGLNNNYWRSTAPRDRGGAPEGWIFPDQMTWLEDRLNGAAGDPSIRYILVIAHEPALPNGGHVQDGMWYGGDNGVRAARWDGGAIRPEPLGVVEVRDALLRMVASNPKVAAVLGSDEHNYSGLLLTSEVPVGDRRTDDGDGDGRICEAGEPCSPLSGILYPTWFLTSGGAGAPHYLPEEAPWNRWWRTHEGDCPDPGGCFRFSVLHHWLLFEVTPERISVETYSAAGERLDRIDDLLRGKSAIRPER